MTEVNKILKDEKEIKIMNKLKKDKVEVSINPRKFLLDYTKEELIKLDAQSVEGLSDEEKNSLEQIKTNLRNNITEYENAKLEAFMVPMKYRDLQTIKSGVFEAVVSSQQYNWEESVKIRAMIREERTLTVYLSLKKKEDITKPYYANLEEVCKETDTTIDELYNIYLANFVITDEERKNS